MPDGVSWFVPAAYDAVWSVSMLLLVGGLGWWLVRVLERWRRRSLARSAQSQPRS